MHRTVSNMQMTGFQRRKRVLKVLFFVSEWQDVRYCKEAAASPLNGGEVSVRFLSLTFFWRRTFLASILMGDLLKHIQHPHNFNLSSAPQRVVSQTNISLNPALTLCLLLLCTCDYHWGIGPRGASGSDLQWRH